MNTNVIGARSDSVNVISARSIGLRGNMNKYNARVQTGDVVSTWIVEAEDQDAAMDLATAEHYNVHGYPKTSVAFSVTVELITSTMPQPT